MSTTVAVRLRAGTTGEAARQAHLATTPPAGSDTEVWTTYCGLRIPAENAEIAHGPAGMPCLPCMLRSMEFGDTTALGAGTA